MCVSDRVMNGDVTARYNPCHGLFDDDDNQEDNNRDRLPRLSLRTRTYVQRWHEETSREEHLRLQTALIADRAAAAANNVAE